MTRSHLSPINTYSVLASPSPRPPVLNIEIPENARFANLQHVSSASAVSICSLCRDLEPGETLAVHKPFTQGIHNDDYIAMFHLFGPQNNALNVPIIIIELGNDADFTMCQCLNTRANVSVSSLCKDMKAGEILAVYKDGSRGDCRDDFVGVFCILESFPAAIEMEGSTQKHSSRIS
ncbi:uncharacterized protein M437DRAFT_59439 [Aureobasidium melanogenum CBS 110374]|uniref:Uncharacterized protein n=1 Tax=Aureobasidium melanogenum (strain CBS 110374) TaxID=1043003 RepID=A0A074W6Z5_AURM1|nr:uncharacterized protein M437DRAFT_59439 [Aureobasidium melanogenum CBS 110374]KEQ58351.1 hypothetical protein M437DRAFT_59439 [Aureobasidium melanogenum CBS 110374]